MCDYNNILYYNDYLIIIIEAAVGLRIGVLTGISGKGAQH